MSHADSSSQRQTSLRDLSDADLIAACFRGRKEAFGDLVLRYQDRVYNVAYRLTSSHEDASEASQEAFLRAFSALKSFRGECSFYTWLFRITVNVVRSRQRYRAVRPFERSLDENPSAGRRIDHGQRSLASDIRAQGPDPAEEASRAEQKILVEQALGRLDPEQRMMIVLRDIEGRDYAEISALLKCRRGTVKSRLHRARMALRELLVPVLAATRGMEG